LWWTNMDIGTNHAEDCFPPSEADFHILPLHIDPSRTFLTSVHQDLKCCRHWLCPLGLYRLRTQNRSVLCVGPEWGKSWIQYENSPEQQWLVSAKVCCRQQVKRSVTFNGYFYSTKSQPLRVTLQEYGSDGYFIQLSPPFILMTSHLRTRIRIISSLLYITTQPKLAVYTMQIFWDHVSTIRTVSAQPTIPDLSMDEPWRVLDCSTLSPHTI
jgi:hypothetical protein